MEEIASHVLVIGGGPGGYVAAIRAGQLGLNTVLVEEAELGGTCLNVGCIPSKALIHAAGAYSEAVQQENTNVFGLTVSNPRIDFVRTMTWKDEIVRRLTGGVDSLLKKAKVKVFPGRAEFLDGKTCVVSQAEGSVRINAKHVIIATGSEPAELGVAPFKAGVISSTEALSLKDVPRSLVVVGAGYIGIELGIAFAKLGCAVSIVELADRILPAWDEELTRPVAKRLEAIGVNVMTSTAVTGISANNETLLIRQLDRKTSKALPFETLLVAVGRKARTDGFGLQKLDLAMDGPFIKINDCCETSMHNVWAVGDVTGEPMLAHRAMAQGSLVAEIIAGQRRTFDKVAIPAVCFSDPEIVSVGLSPDQARSAGYDITVGKFPFSANGKAMTEGDSSGFVRIVARSDSGVVLGIQATGLHVSELSSSFSLGLEMGATLEDVAATIHAHPTRTEAFQEAAMQALGNALHG